MNTRIRELAEQNGFIHNWQPPGEQYEKLQTLEKFAELIVAECINCLKPLSRNHSMVGAAQDTIREHFGVLE
jgi:hypothetical protein